MKLSHRLFTTLLLVTLGACGSEDPQAIQRRVELKRFGSCQQLEQYIKDTAIREMSLRLDRDLDSARQWVENVPMASADAGAAPSPMGEPKAEPGPAAHTETNTQVKDVDEPDFIKNDGNRIFVLSGERLYTAKSWPPSEMALAGQLTVEGHPTQMFLDKKGDRLVIFSTVNAQYWYGSGSCMGDGCGSSNATKVTTVDVSDLSAPQVTGEVWLPGQYRNARRIGSAVRVVLTDHFRWPDGVRWYPDYEYGWGYEEPDPLRLELEYSRLKSENARLIREQPLASWLPSGRAKLDNGKVVEVPYNCSDFYHANASVRLGLATVVSINLEKLTGQPNRTSIVGGVDEIYASTSSLYLAGQHWWWQTKPGQVSYTYLHKFDITDPNKARYVASGGVEGTLVDQFAMDEHQGFFRVATTLSTQVEDEETPWGRVETTNRVTVMGEKEGQLHVVGQTKDLAAGERIFSVRFQGKRGYVVTFRQVDPLFTLNLENPKAPRVVGELKVPGFSTYIHPIDENHLLTIGQHVPEPDATGWQEWNERRMKLSVFDVSNFAAPKEKFTELVGTAYGWSEAAYEHKAFNYFPERKLLAIPFSDYTYNYDYNGDYWDSFVSEVRVFRIDTKTGIQPEGALSLKDIYQSRNDYSWYGYYSPWVRRSVMAVDNEGTEYVYAIADVGIRVAELGSLTQPIKTIEFK